jgi:PHD/YefM family antitoxin component YafN of YafNO toxin-antitoxin module
MFLPEFNSTKLQRSPAEVFNAALKQPVIVTRMAHDSVVMLSKSAYAKLVSNQK